MLIEGRIGTRADSEHYGQHDKKLYDMELEEQGRSDWQDENYCQKSENFRKITRLLSRWKIKLDVRVNGVGRP